MAFLRRAPRHSGVEFSFDGPVLDTLVLSVYLHEHTVDHPLDGLARRFEVEQQGRHQALGDALVTAEIFLHLVGILAARDVRTLGDALTVSEQVTEIRRRQRQFD
jgi:DNA polymerase-3 subunit epsilon